MAYRFDAFFLGGFHESRNDDSAADAGADARRAVRSRSGHDACANAFVATVTRAVLLPVWWCDHSERDVFCLYGLWCDKRVFVRFFLRD